MADYTATGTDNRQDFIRSLVQEKFGREVTAFTRLGRDSNNFVYRVDLTPVTADTDDVQLNKKKLTGHCFGIRTLASSATSIVARLSNPDAVMNEDVRVENEVAAMSLLRAALETLDERLVPDVFAWGRPSKEKPGWMFQEYKGGVSLDEALPDMDLAAQKSVYRQIARLFRLIQSYEVPSSVRKFGGLLFDDTGESIISGPTPIPCGGPFVSLEDMYVQMMRRQLDESESSSLLQGWRGDCQLRERLDQFLARGIAPLVRSNSIARPTLVHGDLNTFNMLVDPGSGILTALIDYDLSHIASPAEEYFYSLRTVGSLLVGPFDDDEAFLLLRECLLNGFDRSNAPKSGKDGKIDWSVARITDLEFSRAGVRRPSEIMGCGELAAVKWFLEDLSPPYFYMPRWLEYQTPKGVEKTLRLVQSNFGKYLDRWNF